MTKEEVEQALFAKVEVLKDSCKHILFGSRASYTTDDIPLKERYSSITMMDINIKSNMPHARNKVQADRPDRKINNHYGSLNEHSFENA